MCLGEDNGGMGSFYRSEHELVFVFQSGSGSFRNNIELGRQGRNRTNVWTYPGANSFGRGWQADLDAHPTVKPMALLADVLLDCTRRGDLVADPFADSGSILLAAERTGRCARAIEIDPGYVDVAIWRWQRLTGQEAVEEGSGLTFTEIADPRQGDAGPEAASHMDDGEVVTHG